MLRAGASGVFDALRLTPVSGMAGPRSAESSRWGGVSLLPAPGGVR